MPDARPQNQSTRRQRHPDPQHPEPQRRWGGGSALGVLLLAAGAAGAGLVYAKPWTWVGGQKPAQAAAAGAPAAEGVDSCCTNLPDRFGRSQGDGPPGMVWVPGGAFEMGDAAGKGMEWERPVHSVSVDGFYVDACEVTNAQFRAFVDATKYVTTAERTPDLQEIMRQSPPGTPPPPPDVLKPGSLVFRKTAGPVPTDGHNWFQWWEYVHGASWRHPTGPDSNVDGKERHPVVQVSWDDAVAYCKWAGKRLPTEAEWEFAARGGLAKQPYTWGADGYNPAKPQANIWQGRFPYKDTKEDGFDAAAPVGQFPANGYGLHDTAGNVWEWTGDWFASDAYARDAARGPVTNPTGPDRSVDPDGNGAPKRTIRGGSFLCNDSYCSSYRPSARMHTSPDSASNHQGFRCAIGKPAWEEQKAKRAAATREAAAATAAPAPAAAAPEVQTVTPPVKIPMH